MKNAKNRRQRVTEEEIEWLLRKEYSYTHNRNTKFYKILEAMVLEILEERESNDNIGGS